MTRIPPGKSYTMRQLAQMLDGPDGTPYKAELAMRSHNVPIDRQGNKKVVYFVDLAERWPRLADAMWGHTMGGDDDE